MGLSERLTKLHENKAVAQMSRRLLGYGSQHSSNKIILAHISSHPYIYGSFSVAFQHTNVICANGFLQPAKHPYFQDPRCQQSQGTSWAEVMDWVGVAIKCALDFIFDGMFSVNKLSSRGQEKRIHKGQRVLGDCGR